MTGAVLAAACALSILFLSTCDVAGLKHAVVQKVEIGTAVKSGTPYIALGSSRVSFYVAPGVAGPAPKTVSVRNVGGGVLSGLKAAVSYGAGSGWLAVAFDTTTAPATLTLTASTAALAVGGYSATVTVSGAGAGNGPLSISVSLTVSSDPGIGLSTGELAFSAPREGPNPAAQVVAVSNLGAGTLSGLGASVVYSSGSGWLTASLNAATAPATLTVAPATGHLAAGEYGATVQVSSSVAGNSPQTVHVSFTVTNYSLAVQAGQGGSITLPASGTASVAYGASTNIAAIPVTGYSFTGWTIVSGACVTFGDAAAASTTVALTGGDAGIKANFTLNTYTLGVQAGSGGTIRTPASGAATVTHGVDASIAAEPSPGYGFVGWTVLSGAGIHFADASSPTTTVRLTGGNATIKASFSSNVAALTVQAQTGGTISLPTSGPQNVVLNIPISIAAQASAGYTFNNWSVVSGTGATIENSLSAATNVKLSAGAVTLQANFSLNSYGLTIQTGTGGSVTTPASSPASVLHGAATTIVAAPSTGYSFSGWTLVSGAGVAFGDPSSASTTATLTGGGATIKANFGLKSYNLSVEAGAGGNVSAPSSSTPSHGVAATIAATPNTGYGFAGWTTTSAGVSFADSSSATTTVTLTGGNATVKANFTSTKAKLTVSVVGLGGTISISNSGSSSSAEADVVYGYATSIAATPNTGYDFHHWSVVTGNAQIVNSFSAATTATLTNGPATIQANFARKTYTLAFQAGSGGSVTTPSGSSTDALHGIDAAITAAPSSGYHFTGWTVLSGTGVSFGNAGAESTTVRLEGGSASIKANFALDSYSLTVQPGSGGSVSAPAGGTATVAHGAATTISASPNTGYDFTSWSVISGSNAVIANSANATTTVTLTGGSAAVQANFALANYTLKVEAAANGSIVAPTGGQATVSYGAATTISASPNSGFVFTGWSVVLGSGAAIANSANATTTVTLTGGSATVQANFASSNSNLVVQAGMGGRILDPSGGAASVSIGASTNIAAANNTGYTFSHWSTLSGSASFGNALSASTTVTLTGSSATIQANFSLNTYGLTVQAGAGGSIAAPASSPTAANHGIPATIAATPGTGYSFFGWTVASGGGVAFGNAGAANTTVTLTGGDAAIAANFSINSYNLSYDSNGASGGTAPAGGTVSYNQSVAVAGNTGSLAKTGHSFVGWNSAPNGSGTAYSAGNSFSMPASNLTLYAQWSILSYSVAYSSNGATSGSAPSGGSYQYGQSVAIALNAGNLAKTGSTFAGWNDTSDGSGTSYTPGGSFAMGAANLTLYAKWTAIPYSVTYDPNGATSGSAPSVGTYTYGQTVTASANTGSLARTGYTFEGWNTAANGSGTSYAAGSGTFSMPTSSLTLYAQWSMITYSLTVSSGGNGATTPSGTQTVNYGAATAISATPASYYRFTSWTVPSGTASIADASAASTTAALTAGAATVQATFDRITYTLTLPSDGSTSPSGARTVNAGAATSISATAPTGYSFSGWRILSGSGASFGNASQSSTTVALSGGDAAITADFVANNYNLAYSGNGADSGTAPSGGSYTYNVGVTVSDNSAGLSKTGYTFSGWDTVANGSGTHYSAGGTLVIPATDITLYAQWSANQYQVTFDAQSGATPNPSSIDVTYDSTYGSLATTSRTGYTFGGWWTAPSGGGSQIQSSTTVAITANQTLYAKWTANQYAVSFDGQGGSSPSPASLNVTYDSAYGTLATTSRTGYTFDGWWTGAGGSGSQIQFSTTVSTTAAQTLYAKWTANQYTVSFDGQSGSTPSPASIQVTYDSTYGSLATTSRSGYNFGGWWTGTGGTGSQIQPSTTVAITANQTLYAKWSGVPSTVTFDGQSGSSPSPSSINVTYGSTYGTLATTSRTGYTFGGWWTGAGGAGSQIQSSTTVSITAAQTLYAKWTANQYAVAFDSQSGSTPSPTSIQVTYDSTYGALATTSRTGYAFGGWWTGTGGTGSQIQSSTAVTITAAQTLYAKWTANQYTVTFDGQGGSAPSPSSINVTFVSTYGTLATTSRANYTFGGWWTGANGTGSQVQSSTTVAITANQTLYAKWTGVQSTVSFDAQGGSYLSPPSIQVNYGSTYGTLATTSRDGYAFAGWWTVAGGGGLQVQSSTTVAITSNQTLYAYWVPNQYTVSFDAQGGSPSYPSPIQVTYASTYGGLPTPARDGYTFGGWWTGTGGTGSQIQSGTQVTITANQTLYAMWVGNQYLVYFDGQGGSTPGSIQVTYGSTYGSLTMSTRTGYNFAGWWTGAGGTGTEIQSFSTVTTPSNHTLYAKWTGIQSTVSFDAQGGSTPSPTSIQVTYGSTYGTLATTSLTGYTFAGWWTGAGGTGSQIQSSTTVATAASQTLYAKWTANQYTVTFDGQGGSTPSPTSIQVTYGSTYGSLAWTERTGYGFWGWWTGPGGAGIQIQPDTTVTITANQTLYAKWTVNQYLLSYDLNGASEGGYPNPTLYNYGDWIQAGSGVTKRKINVNGASYRFTGWNTQLDGYGTAYADGQSFQMGAQYTTLYAMWTPYAPGDIGPAGGIVVLDLGSYSWHNGRLFRYLEAGPYDVPTGLRAWDNSGSYNSVGGTSSSLGAGYDNTYNINSLLGASGQAAQASTAFEVVMPPYVFNDWCLPSEEELLAMMSYSGPLGMSGEYWSSTQSDNWYAQTNIGTRDKQQTYKVRPIRGF